MSLINTWISTSYDAQGNSNSSFWKSYMPREQKVYEDILENKIDSISSNVKDFGEKYNLEDYEVIGFLDGISGGLVDEIDVEELETDSNFEIEIDFIKLYKKMVEYKAKHLYTLEQWNSIIDEEEQRELYDAQKSSGTIVKEERVGRNEPCPCGSGRKYKHCCGK